MTWELAEITGGVDPSGGFGKMTGLIVALLVLQVILSWFNLPGMSGYLPIALWGGILIFLLFFNYVRVSRTRATL